MRWTRDADLAFLWAAYRKGAFNDVLLPDLPVQNFKEAVMDMMASVDLNWVVTIGDDLVGLFMARIVGHGHAIEPQVDWMPWASKRQQLEATFAFLSMVSREWKVLVYSAEKDAPFYGRLATKYRILRKGCKIVNYFGGGDDAMLYYSPGPF